MTELRLKQLFKRTISLYLTNGVNKVNATNHTYQYRYLNVSTTIGGFNWAHKMTSAYKQTPSVLLTKAIQKTFMR